MEFSNLTPVVAESDAAASVWDATFVAKKAVAAVYATEQRFGMFHLVDVLTGKRSLTAIRNRHNELAVFGSGSELSRRSWQSVYRQLLAQRILSPGNKGFGALRCNDLSLSVMQGTRTVIMEALPAQSSRRYVRPMPSQYDPQREQLYRALLERRSAILRANQVNEVNIFHDGVLNEIIKQRPRNTRELLQITGIDQQKAKTFGRELLEVVTSFQI